MTLTAIITGYGGPAVRADTLQLIGSGFGRVSSAALVRQDGEAFEVDHIVDNGFSVTITVPQLLPDGTYVPVLGTLDNVDSQNLAGPIVLPGLPLGPPPRPPRANPVPDASSPALRAIRRRLRLEVGDHEEPFQASVQGDGFTRRFDLPVEVVTAAGLSVMVAEERPTGGYLPPVPVHDYELDERAGVLTLQTPPANDAQMTVTGINHQFFTDAELDDFIVSAALKHTHSAEELSVWRDARGFKRFQYVNQTVDGINPVEHHAVALLAATEALEVIRTDAAYDIDVVTADGTSLPRSERFRNLGELIAEKRTVYDDLCRQLGVGLNRIEVFTMRRVSRTTGRLVPVYVDREFDDRRPVAPLRLFAPRNLGITGSAFVQRDGHRGYSYDDVQPDQPALPPVTPEEPPSPTSEQTLYVKAGTTYRRRFTWARRTEAGAVVPYDLTGATALLQVRPHSESDTVLLELRDGSGITLGGVQGTIEVLMTPQQTDGLPATRPFYDMVVRLADGDVHRVLEGRIEVDPNVSRLP